MVEHVEELYRYRALVQSLVVRDVKARYRGSVLGFLWTFLNPLILMATYALVFSVYIRIGMERYALFVLAGLLPWMWFSSSLLQGATSVVDGSALIKKVFFPAQVLPTVTVLAGAVNFVLSLPLFLVFLLLYRVPVTWTAIAVLPVMVVQLVLTLGLVLLMAGLTVRYRDLPQLLANVLTLWFFISPIIYPPSQIPDAFRLTLLLNPMAPLVIAYQDALLFHRPPAWAGIGLSAAVGATLFVIGSTVFDHLKWAFAEQV